jgi:hypothetical protein
MSHHRDLPHVGWREWVVLPELGVARIKAKIDTGARTGSLHAFGLETFEREGRSWVRFAIHPEQSNDNLSISVEHPVSEFRHVRSSNGLQSLRPVIVTQVNLGRFAWTTELTLADRDAMGFRMLLGRHSIRGQFLVDPGRSFLRKRRKHSHRPGHPRHKT